MVSNDSGPMHMAAALGVPVLGLFGPTDPESTGPYPPGRPSNRVLRSPMGRMEELSTREVLNCVWEMLGKN